MSVSFRGTGQLAGVEVGFISSQAEERLVEGRRVRGKLDEGDAAVTAATRRVLTAAAAAGDADAQFALDVYALRARQGIAAAADCLDRLDGVAFTGEIGVDQPALRASMCGGLGTLGVTGDLRGDVDGDATLSKPGSAGAIVVLTVGEELEVAAETRRILSTA